MIEAARGHAVAPARSRPEASTLSTAIYTFSGTGNSLAVARGVAQRTGARVLSMARAVDGGEIRPLADAVGLVFPVYHSSLPQIVRRFIERLDGLEDKYLFGVCTYGDGPALALPHLAAALAAQGGELAAGFGVRMPYNYLTPSPVIRGFLQSFTLRDLSEDRTRALLRGSQERAEQIAACVNARERYTDEVRADPISRLVARLGLKESLGKAVWLRVAGVRPQPELTFGESLRFMSRAFWADESCIACGTCARVCPVRNIAWVKGRPTWGQRCEQCFACLQWCPREAIQFGQNTAGRPRYHHPEVTVADMAEQAARE